MLTEKKMTNQERSDLSDKRMLGAAIELILEKGTEKTTLKDVGEKAGYSRGLAGYRFGSKAGLFSFVLHKLSDYWLRDLTEATENKVGLDAIFSATEKHYELFESNPDNVRAFYILWFDIIGAEDELKELVININNKRNKDIAKWIREDDRLAAKHDEADAIATHYNATMNGVIYYWLLNPSDLATLKALHDNVNKTMRLILDI